MLHAILGNSEFTESFVHQRDKKLTTKDTKEARRRRDLNSDARLTRRPPHDAQKAPAYREAGSTVKKVRYDVRPMHRLFFILFCTSAVLAQQDDVLLTATHDKLNATIREALAADSETLKKWSKKGPRGEEAKKEFCPHYEKRYLSGFYSALAESKQGSGDKAREASAKATWMIYLLASLRSATKEDLRQLALKAKEGAPESVSKEDQERGFATRSMMERNLAQLDQPPPGRLRIAEEVANCFLISKVQPRYPMQAKMERLQGNAVIKIVVGSDGKLMQMTPISGPPILMDASLAGVQHWLYRPYYFLGQPVEFESEVKVSFTMSGG
jgi:Gram-negative bacterial TonB protein C-terminal